VGVGVPEKDNQLFLENLPVIDAAVGHVCRRHRLTADEADDFSSGVRLHFIERNYEPLRRYQGRSSLRTYLIVVVNHLFLDYRNKQWGKWRPSAEATRIGAVAIQFEKLVVRDGWSVTQAIELLVTNHRFSSEEIASLDRLKTAERAPAREMVSEFEAEDVEGGPSPEENVVRAEQDFLARRVKASLDRARQALEPEDRLILRMRFEDSMSVADIARALHRDQKRLYRTIEGLFAMLRERFVSDGISREDVASLFASAALQDQTDDSGGDPQPGSDPPAATVRAGGRRG
jgi:RNA polymerase sigma factor (sigma-70 family)